LWHTAVVYRVLGGIEELRSHEQRSVADPAVPQLFIVADNPLQRIALAEVVARSGFEVLYNISSERLTAALCQSSPSLWLVDVTDEDTVLEAIGYDQPFMIGITRAPSPVRQRAYASWVNGFSAKLNKLLGEAPPLLMEFVEESEVIESEIPDDQSIGRTDIADDTRVNDAQINVSKNIEKKDIEAKAASTKATDGKPDIALSAFDRELNAWLDEAAATLPSASTAKGVTVQYSAVDAISLAPIIAAPLVLPVPVAAPKPVTAALEIDWEYVCVLAASMGGPEAVKRFLDAVPMDAPVTFVLVQHIDANMQAVLPRILGRHNVWHFKTEKDFATNPAQPSLYLQRGHVLIVPALRQIRFGTQGEVYADEHIQSDPLVYEPWPGIYRPSIDEVMRRAAVAFGTRLITIVFSGMGDDGSAAILEVNQREGQVWAQTADSCVCASQPDSVRAAGHVEFNGTPEALARYLAALVAVAKSA